MNNVDTYVMQFNPEVQHRISLIRKATYEVYPGAEERIYHGVPTFSHNGIDILSYGAYKNHITIYIGYDRVSLLRPKYPEYQYGAASIKILNNIPFPGELVTEINVML